MLARNIEKAEKFLDFVSKDTINNNQQFTDFLKWCIEHDMMANVTDEDLNYCYENDSLDLPLFTNHGITISADVRVNGDVQIGIDPSSCFNKNSSSSIIALLPLKSKREITRFYKLLDKVFDKKSSVSKDWFKEAPTCWYGSFASFS